LARHSAGLVAQSVAQGVRVTTAKRHRAKVEIPTKEQVRERLASAQGRERALLITAVFTGLRASELRGLRWCDVDFAGRVIQVRQRADAGGRIGSLKSESAGRDIPMTPMVANTLKEWRLVSPNNELVFRGRDRRPLCHTTLRDMLGRLHQYRHFYASWLIDQGFGPKRVQYLLGHSGIQMTFDTYGHLFPAEDDHDRLAAAELALVG
jgi:integrase